MSWKLAPLSPGSPEYRIAGGNVDASHSGSPMGEISSAGGHGGTGPSYPSSWSEASQATPSDDRSRSGPTQPAGPHTGSNGPTLVSASAPAVTRSHVVPSSERQVTASRDSSS